jgi:hypothetical protein
VGKKCGGMWEEFAEEMWGKKCGGNVVKKCGGNVGVNVVEGMWRECGEEMWWMSLVNVMRYCVGCLL